MATASCVLLAHTSSAQGDHTFKSRQRAAKVALLPLDHSRERAGPGWYALNVSGMSDAPAPTVEVLLAASGSHAGVHSYRFDEGSSEECGLSFDACHGAWPAKPFARKWCKNATISVQPSLPRAGGTTMVSVRASVDFAGQLSARALNGSLRVYFYAEVDGAINTTSSSAASVARVRVPCSNAHTTHVRAAISYISQDMAMANLHVQAPFGTTALQAKATAQAAWSKVLSASGVTIVDAADASRSEQIAFATAVYRTHLAPTIWDEPGLARNGSSRGRYMGMDHRVHELSSSSSPLREHAYTDMSLWDIHRTQLPWLSLTSPDVYVDIIRSLEAMGEEGGDVPRWPLANIYTGCMIGNHAIIVVAEAVAKGCGHLFNVSKLYNLFKRHATEPRHHAGRANVAEYLHYGYVPHEDNEHAVSLTLAYAFDDANLASIASYLGLTHDAANFTNRSNAAIRAGWSAEHEFMCPRTRDGALKCPLLPFVPYPGSPHYVEGDAWQWLWFVPSSPQSLVKLFSTPSRFVDKLETFLQRARKIKSTTLANPYYWAGNEPDILAPWLFAFVPGALMKTGEATRWIATNRYNDKPDGLPGNDDFGALSAWLVWAQLGLYPLAGTATFILGAPRFGEVVVALGGGGGTLRIVAHNASATHTTIVKAAVNGVAIDVVNHPFVRFGELVLGEEEAVLEVWMKEGIRLLM